MGRIAHFRNVLKEELAGGMGFLAEGLCPSEILEAAGETYQWRERIWTPLQTLWTFLVQVLHPGWPCRAAVAEVLGEQAAAGSTVPVSSDPTAYCQGRKRLPLSLFQGLLRRTGQSLQAKVDGLYRWCGRRVWVVDGSSCSMPDTPALQKTFGQPNRQKPGCGFPVAKIVAMFDWASGVVLDVAIGAYRSSELTLWRQLWDLLHPEDIVLGDRFYGAYADMAQLVARGCDGVFRLRGARGRTADFRRGKRLGKNDRRVTWSRSEPCPRTLSADEFASLPRVLEVRMLRFVVAIAGFRSQTVMVATTLLDAKQYPLDQIAALYRDRWTVELRLRDIKTTMRMEVVRGKSPDVIRKEIYMHLLAYNLIRGLMWQAAEAHGQLLHRLSFAGTLWRVDALAPYLWLLAGTPKAAPLHRLLLSWIARDRLPYRPNRVEPRAVKRRPKPHKLLTRPRNQMRQALLK